MYTLHWHAPHRAHRRFCPSAKRLLCDASYLTLSEAPACNRHQQPGTSLSSGAPKTTLIKQAGADSAWISVGRNCRAQLQTTQKNGWLGPAPHSVAFKNQSPLQYECTRRGRDKLEDFAGHPLVELSSGHSKAAGYMKLHSRGRQARRSWAPVSALRLSCASTPPKQHFGLLAA